MAQAANNIIKGPWEQRTYSVEPNVTIVDNGVAITTSGVSLIKHNHICETLMAVVPLLFNNIELAGFSIDPAEGLDDTIKDGTLIVEAIKSLLCKHYGIHHPLQQVADALFEIDDVKGLDFAERLDIDLDPMEQIIAVIEEADDDVEALEE